MVDSGVIVELILIVVKVVVVGLIVFSLPLPLTWLERKVAGHIQVRLGPYRVGFHGVLQPFADMVKMLLKEDIIPDKADRRLFKLAPFIALAPVFAVFVVIGGLRSTAQMVSYEVALSFAAIGVVMMTNSLSLVEIVRSQSGGILNWNIFYLPVGPVWFAIFFIAGLAESNRIPFDLAEDEGTLGAGFHAEYSGMRFGFFMTAEYVAMVTISILAVLLFLRRLGRPLRHTAAADSLVHYKGRGIHILLHVGPVHLPKVPLRPAYDDRLEGAHPAVACYGSCYRVYGASSTWLRG
jgi:NADH-quinone oxidoreductase subunit H